MIWIRSLFVYTVFALTLLFSQTVNLSTLATPPPSFGHNNTHNNTPLLPETMAHYSNGAIGQLLTDTKVYSDDYPLHPGFPVSIPGHVTRSSPTVVDLDNDGQNELLLGTYNGEVYAWTVSGTLRSGYPLTTGGSIIGHLAFGDLNGDDQPEIVAGVSSTETGVKGRIYVWQADGTNLPDWPQNVARYGDAKTSKISSVVVADIDNDKDFEVIAGTNNNVIGTGDELKPVPDLYVWEHTGNLVAGWPAQEEPAIAGTIAVGDFNTDGQPDILVGRDYNFVFAYDNQGAHLPNWPVQTYIDKNGNDNNVDPRIVHKRSAPTLADLDNDGIFEYIVTGMRRDPDISTEIHPALLLLQPDGSRHPDWLTTEEGIGLLGDDFEMQQGAAIADINSDNHLDMIAAFQDGWIRAYAADQTLIWEFDYAQGGVIHATEPVIGDVDGDNLYEVVFGAHDPLLSTDVLTTGLWILENDGSPKYETPLPVDEPGIMAAPTLADFDSDGLLEIVAVTRKGKVYVWDTPSLLNPFRLPWPVARYDIQRTASFDDARFDVVKTANTYFIDQEGVVTYTIRLERTDAPLTYTIQMTDIIPAGLSYISGTLTATRGILNDDLAPILSWEGRLSDTNLLTITYSVIVTETAKTPITNTVTIGALSTGSFTRTNIVFANPDKVYLPAIRKE